MHHIADLFLIMKTLRREHNCHDLSIHEPRKIANVEKHREVWSLNGKSKLIYGIFAFWS